MLQLPSKLKQFMIIAKNQTVTNRELRNLFQGKLPYRKGNLKTEVEKLLIKRSRLLTLSKKFPTPFYIFDNESFTQNCQAFKTAFLKYIPDLQIFYPIKLNHQDYFIQAAIKNGLGADVASIRELDLALKFKASRIVYYSPGKTTEDLGKIVKTRENIIINLDNFNELKRLGQITDELKKSIPAGIRIFLPSFGDWMKYGIDINRLKDFWNEAKKYKYLKLQGIHFHTSRNSNADFYVKTIKTLAAYLKARFEKAELGQITFIDFGGGFDTNLKEGFYPKDTNQGKILSIFNSRKDKKVDFVDWYYLKESLTIERYAETIGRAINTHLRPIVPQARYFTEPGRIICNDHMHILLKVVDVKNKDMIIVDGGVNLVGWQRFEYEYFPLINLSHPSLDEKKCRVYGNLCTTWDIWGYYLYSGKIKEGDYILVPYQGALTYSLAQSFISPIAKVHKL